MRTHDVALWNGNDTSLGSPTTTQYFGVIGQIVAGGNTTIRVEQTLGTNFTSFPPTLTNTAFVPPGSLGLP